MKSTLKFMLLTAAALFSTTAFAQDADDIVQDYLKALGGADNLSAMTSMKMVGESSSPQGSAPVTIIRQAPNKSKTLVSMMGSEMTFAYDGETAWMINPWVEGGKPTKLEGEQAQGMSEDKFENPFLNYADKGHTVKFLGEEDVNDEEHYKVRLTTKDGKEMIYSFNVETGLPTQMKMLATSGQAKGSIVMVTFEDYKEVDGIMMPHKRTESMDGNVVRTTVTSEITINEAFDDSLFAFPKDEE